MQSRPSSRLRERMEYYIADGVASGQGLGASEKDYESEQLQRSDRVAESDASGYGGLPGDQGISKGGNLRSDEPSEASGSVDSVKHSGRTSTEGDGGVQELPLDSSGVVGGSGDTTTDRQKPAISLRVGTEASTRTSRGDRQDAQFSNQKTSHQPLATQPLTVSSPEEIRLIDPACGSGHILTYAFDLLYAIYEEEGYEPSSIPGHILTKNLHGVEIDERAAELAYFALMMKAQQHYGRFLRRQLRAEPRERISPQICCMEEIHFEEGELKTYMDALAECKRLTAKKQRKIAEDLEGTYLRLRDNFESFGFLWGELRCNAALKLICRADLANPMQDIPMEGIDKTLRESIFSNSSNDQILFDAVI